MKAHLQIMLGDIQGADASLSEAKEYAKKPEAEKSPYYYNNYLSSKFIYDLYHLEEAVKNGNKQKFFEYRKKAAKSGKKVLKNARKVACDLTQALNLMAIYCWLINKQKKALKWWDKGIEAGEKLDARVELSRTYYEIGKRLSEPKSRYSELGGKKANEYLTMARSLFEELGLQKDIEELDQTLNERK